MSCPLCSPAPERVLFENDDALVILHDDHAVRGHLIIVARRHVENVSGLTEAEWLRVARVWHRTEQILLETTGADRSIVMKLGVMTPHLHLHLYPVAADATREEIFAAIDGRTSAGEDRALAAALGTALRSALSGP